MNHDYLDPAAPPQLTLTQELALVEADGLGYGAKGAGRLRTARALRDLGLVEIRPWNGWVTLTPRGRAHLYSIRPADQAPGSAPGNASKGDGT